MSLAFPKLHLVPGASGPPSQEQAPWAKEQGDQDQESELELREV